MASTTLLKSAFGAQIRKASGKVHPQQQPRRHGRAWHGLMGLWQPGRWQLWVPGRPGRGMSGWGDAR